MKTREAGPTLEPGLQARPERAPDLKLEWRKDGQLWAVRNGEEKPVRVRRLFPWSVPARHVSLRDAHDHEFALVGPREMLDAASAQALDEAMVAAGFVLEVTAVLDIDEEVEVRAWKVETRQGARTFQTHLDDWPRETPGGGLLIRDVAGDLYHVPRPAALDPESREWLWAFVD